MDDHGCDFRSERQRAGPRRASGLAQAEMVAAVVPLSPQRLWPGGAKAMWWMKTVQLDLEAKGLVARDAATRPMRWRPT